MKADSRSALRPEAGGRQRWLRAASGAAFALGLAVLPFALDSQQRQPSNQLEATAIATATPAAAAAAAVAPVVTDQAWSGLSVIEQRTLEPLRDTWPTLTAAQRKGWQLIADRFQAKPRQDQRRLAARIAEWSSLSPQQRARARLAFLELAKRYNPRQREAQWQAYQNAKPAAGHAANGHAPPRLVPPVLVQASHGATTVLLSRLFERPLADEGAERRGSAVDSLRVDEVNMPPEGILAEGHARAFP